MGLGHSLSWVDEMGRYLIGFVRMEGCSDRLLLNLSPAQINNVLVESYVHQCLTKPVKLASKSIAELAGGLMSCVIAFALRGRGDTR